IGRVDTGAEVAVLGDTTRFDLNAGLDMGILRFTTGARFVNDADPADPGLRGIVPGWAGLAEGMTYHVGLGLPLEWRAFTITPVVDAVIADADASTDGAE